MFRDARALDRHRTASAFDAALEYYAAAKETWFNGSVDSIDQRLASCDKLLHSARATVARLSIADSGRYLHAAEELDADRQALASLRADLLTGASGRADVTGPPGWRTADRPGSWYQGTEEQGLGSNPHGMHPNNYTSRQEFLDAANLRSYLQDASDQHPGAGDYPVPDDIGSQSVPPGGGYQPRPVDPDYKKLLWEKHAPGGGKDEADERGFYAALAGADRRWVTLEAAKFVAANTDALDDSHELATRAAAYADIKTSTFTKKRSAAISRAFVAQVGELGKRSYRPTVKQAAVYEDFDPQVMFL